MQALLDIKSLKELAALNDRVLLDARSPKEFEHAHIPNAKNLPLLNNEERHVVGLTYKEHGHEAAVKRGFQLVGHKFADYINQASELAINKKVLVYCWRGGLRSNIIAWLLNMAGYDVVLLKSGYKRFRHLVLEEFAKPKKLMVISGKTGSGKTALLHELARKKENVIDLEGIANHKGSAFGSLGQPPQPSVEQFENLIAMQLAGFNSNTIWLEDESVWIGRVKIPTEFFKQICDAPAVRIERSMEVRKELILKEYGCFAIADLKEKTTMLEKRLGGDRLKMALEFLDENNLDGWVQIMFQYYDKNYGKNMEERGMIKTEILDFGMEKDLSKMAQALLQLKK
jgi:tRNA 2-selenouridine synthase